VGKRIFVIGFGLFVTAFAVYAALTAKPRPWMLRSFKSADGVAGHFTMEEGQLRLAVFTILPKAGEAPDPRIVYASPHTKFRTQGVPESSMPGLAINGTHCELRGELHVFVIAGEAAPVELKLDEEGREAVRAVGSSRFIGSDFTALMKDVIVPAARAQGIAKR
jgi:hypothetical protein